MDAQIKKLYDEKNYDKLAVMAAGNRAPSYNDAGEVYAFAKALEKKSAYSQSAEWYIRYCELTKSDDAFGMAAGVLLAIADYEGLKAILEKYEELADEFYYSAAQFELHYRTGFDYDILTEDLDKVLDIRTDETYFIKKAIIHVLMDDSKEAVKICRKVIRLYPGERCAEYAERFMDAIKDEHAKEFLEEDCWQEDGVFKHISFDLTAPMCKNVRIEALVEKQEKKNKPVQDKKEKIAPIVEKSFSEIVGMAELKHALTNVLNILQSDKKRVGFKAILKNNLIIVGPDGCGKTTAAIAAAQTYARLGVIGDEIPHITDYDRLIGANDEETHDNIQKLFEEAEDGCILIDNIERFNDAGAYGNGMMAIDMIVKAYMAAEESIPLIITGDEKAVGELLEKKKKLGELFNLPQIILGRYSVDELVEIAVMIADHKGLFIEEEARALLKEKLEHMVVQSDFKYSRDLENIINRAYINQTSRLAKKRRNDENEYFLIRAVDIDYDSSEDEETVEELLDRLNAMTGLASVKEQVGKIVNQAKVRKLAEQRNISTDMDHGSLHLVFMGNAGTGKTTVARIIGKIYRRLGVLPSGQLIECSRRDLVAQHVGGTAKLVEEKVKEAMGGILFIDEAYSLCTDDSDVYGKEAIDSLLKDIEDHRDNFMVILAGYNSDMNKFMDKNQGLRSRIPTDILFEDYTTDEMISIFRDFVKSKNMLLEDGLIDDIGQIIETQARKRKDFGNARGVRNIFEKIVLNQNNRLGQMNPQNLSDEDFITIRRADIELDDEETGSSKSVEDYLAELDALTGLSEVKRKVNRIVDAVRINKLKMEAGLPSAGFGTLHLVFKGNAGTGKTTVARIIGNIYRELGVLPTGQLIECGRSDLVAGYAGQTALKVKAKVKEALGGILFIDEAYALAGDDFGREAIDTLVADIENYRSSLMVIIAGYSENMDVFLSQNQGLSSRFPNEILFEDYSMEEMVSIFKGMLAARGYELASEMDETINRVILDNRNRETDFGNARGVRNIIDRVLEKQMSRMASMLKTGKIPTNKELTLITEEDLLEE